MSIKDVIFVKLYTILNLWFGECIKSLIEVFFDRPKLANSKSSLDHVPRVRAMYHHTLWTILTTNRASREHAEIYCSHIFVKKIDSSLSDMQMMRVDFQLFCSQTDQGQKTDRLHLSPDFHFGVKSRCTGRRSCLENEGRIFVIIWKDRYKNCFYCGIWGS